MPPISGYFDIPFAENGDLNTIPDATQPSGTVSYNQGFPVLYSTPVTSGGYNVPRTAMNQVLNDITTAVQNWQQNTIAPFITTSMNGGTPFSYPQYAMVVYSGVAYISLTGSNTDTPPSTKWMMMSFRQKLAGNITYYVATTGNDSNPGTSGSPWLTIQHAINYVQNNVDLNGFIVTISVADGSYGAGIIVSGSFTGAGTVLLQGNVTTPANCIIAAPSGDCIAVTNNAQISVAGLKLTATSGNGIASTYGGLVKTYLMDFNTLSGTFSAHLYANACGKIAIQNNYNITGGAAFHLAVGENGVIVNQGATAWTVSGTPAFSKQFANVGDCGVINTIGGSYSGSATGTRYNAILNGVINTGSSSSSTYFPGNVNGSTATGGQYV